MNPNLINFKQNLDRKIIYSNTANHHSKNNFSNWMAIIIIIDVNLRKYLSSIKIYKSVKMIKLDINMRINLSK